MNFKEEVLRILGEDYQIQNESVEDVRRGVKKALLILLTSLGISTGISTGIKIAVQNDYYNQGASKNPITYQLSKNKVDPDYKGYYKAGYKNLEVKISDMFKNFNKELMACNGDIEKGAKVVAKYEKACDRLIANNKDCDITVSGLARLAKGTLTVNSVNRKFLNEIYKAHPELKK